MTVRTCLLFLAACGHVVAYAPASLAQKLDLDALYERAAAEGEVSAYLQGPPQVYAGFVNAFEAKYPKIKVRITSGRYDLMPKIDAQIAAGAMDADLAILQTTQDYVRWKRQGALQSFAPADFDLIPARLKDPDAQFLPVFLVMIGLAYNPMQVSDAEAPRTIADFLKPAFKGKIVSTYPHDDDLTLYSNTLIVETYGWGMIEKLLQQDMKFVRSHVLVAQETAKGERPVTFDQISQFNKVASSRPRICRCRFIRSRQASSPKHRIPTPQSFSWLSPSPRSSSNGRPRPAPYRSDRMSDPRPGSNLSRVTGSRTDTSTSFPMRHAPRSCAKDLKAISGLRKGPISAPRPARRRNSRKCAHDKIPAQDVLTS